MGFTRPHQNSLELTGAHQHSLEHDGAHQISQGTKENPLGQKEEGEWPSFEQLFHLTTTARTTQNHFLVMRGLPKWSSLQPTSITHIHTHLHRYIYIYIHISLSLYINIYISPGPSWAIKLRREVELRPVPSVWSLSG